MPTELLNLIEVARSIQMTPEQEEEQAINFVYGNISFSDDTVTLTDVIRASESLRNERSEPASAISNRC